MANMFTSVSSITIHTQRMLSYVSGLFLIHTLQYLQSIIKLIKHREKSSPELTGLFDVARMRHTDHFLWWDLTLRIHRKLRQPESNLRLVWAWELQYRHWDTHQASATVETELVWCCSEQALSSRLMSLDFPGPRVICYDPFASSQ